MKIDQGLLDMLASYSQGELPQEVLGDYLEERGDERAEGVRELETRDTGLRSGFGKVTYWEVARGDKVVNRLPSKAHAEQYLCALVLKLFEMSWCEWCKGTGNAYWQEWWDQGEACEFCKGTGLSKSSGVTAEIQCGNHWYMAGYERRRLPREKSSEPG